MAFGQFLYTQMSTINPAHHQKTSNPRPIEVGDIVVATHPEYYGFGPGGFFGIVVSIDDETIPRKITFMKNNSLWSFYEDDLGLVDCN